MVGVGIIGYGYWGPNLARNFSVLPDSKLVAICDLSEARLARAAERHPEASMMRDHQALIAHPEIDAVVIATPISTHCTLALAALEAGKHVWVEKAFTSSVGEAEQLIQAADRRGLTLSVDHTFVYSGAVRKIKELIDEGRIGKPYYYDSVRVNLGLFQRDVNVLWDLAVHDLSIMDFVLNEKPVAVSATGIGHVVNRPENVAYLTCFFDSDLIGHVHVNWLAPAKIRMTLIGGDRQMIMYDDIEPDQKVKVFDKGIMLAESPDAIRKVRVGYRTGDMWAPFIERVEALNVEASHFLECIDQGKQTITDGRAGLRVIQVLEAATRSMELSGRPVELR